MNVHTFLSHNGTCTYLVSDESSREAMIIDPMNDHYVKDYMSFLKEHELHLKYIFDTHTHADHISGSIELKEATNAIIVMSEHSPSSRKDMAAKDGDPLTLGSRNFTVMYTPGHTNESLCLYTAGMVFTGDTMLIGGTGRTDFQLGNSESLYSSLQSLLALPDETIVYPGHEYKGRKHSTIATEKKQSPRLQLTKEDFIEAMNNHHPDLPDLFKASLSANVK